MMKSQGKVHKNCITQVKIMRKTELNLTERHFVDYVSNSVCYPVSYQDVSLHALSGQ